MATTEDAVLDRIRDVCVAQGYAEAVDGGFARVPEGAAVDGVFVAQLDTDVPRGGMGFHEEARAFITIELARPRQNDYDAARRQALQDGRALLNAIIQDGERTSGEYAIEDVGRAVTILSPKGASVIVVRLRLTINFEAVLT